MPTSLSRRRKLLLGAVTALIVLVVLEVAARSYSYFRYGNASAAGYGWSFASNVIAGRPVLTAGWGPGRGFTGSAKDEFDNADTLFANRADGAHVIRPQQSRVITFNGGIPVRLNNLGYRGADVSTSSPGVRVATFGGSYVFGATLKDDETWPLRLEQDFKKRGLPADVINAGVSGSNITGVLQEVVNLTNSMPIDIALVTSAYNNHPLLPIERRYSMARRTDAYLYNLSLFYVMFKERLARALSEPLDYGLYHQQMQVKPADAEWLIGNYRRVVDHIDAVCREKNVTLVLVSQPEVFFDTALNAQSSQTEATIDALTRRISSGEPIYLAELEFYLQGRLNLELRRAARDHERLFIDGEAVLMSDKAGNFSDQIHPSSLGATRLAAALAETLAPVIAARADRH